MDTLNTENQKSELNAETTVNYLENLKKGLDLNITSEDILSKISSEQGKVEDQITDFAMSQSALHPDFSVLAARIRVSLLHRKTKRSFAEKMTLLYNQSTSAPNSFTPSITEEELEIIQLHKNHLENVIIYDRDHNFNIFTLKKLEEQFLAKINGQIVERPQDAFMRIAISIHKDNIEEVVKTYTYMSEGMLLHLPFHLQKNKNTHSNSPYSIALGNENLTTLFNQLNNCAQQSQEFEDVGIAIHDVPSERFLPTLSLLNETVHYMNCEEDNTNRPFTMYLEPWHGNIFEFITLKNGDNTSDFSAAHLNLALWIPDLFMERIENNSTWTLMCPDECPGLSDTHGLEFEMLYKKYENEGKGLQTIKAKELWFKILETQIELGTTRIFFKDQMNKKFNSSAHTHKTPGYSKIKQTDEIKNLSVVNCVSIALPTFVNENTFDFKKLHKVISRITKESNTILKQHQNKPTQSDGTKILPFHIEIQGLSEVFLKLKIPYHSIEAQEINKEILMTIQAASDQAARELSKRKKLTLSVPSLMTTYQASRKSKSLGNHEGISPLSSYINTYQWGTENTMVANAYLLNDLKEFGLWSPLMLQKIIQNQGSIQNISELPKHLREVYKTAWEVPQKDIIDRISACEYLGVQPQSMEVFIENPDFNKLTSIYFYSWKKGLSTGASPLRTKINPETMEFSMNKEIAI